MTAQFKLSILDCDTSDPFADFFDARASVACRGLGAQTAFTVAGRDLQAFVADAGRLREAARPSALLLGGWDAEKRLRLLITLADRSDTFETRVCILSHDDVIEADKITETEFLVRSDALSAFLTEVQHLVDRRELGDAILNGDADAA
ncbi:MAG TPA: hypothetical protein VF785_03795 [Gemmatimonadaceae bacterium]